MTDILGRAEQTYAGTFSSDEASISFPLLDPGVDAAEFAAGDYGFVMQNVSLNYQQPISRIRDLRSSGVLIVAGPATGNGEMGAVLVARGAFSSFLQVYGNPCNAKAKSMQIAMGNGLCSGDGAAAGAGRPIVLDAGFVVLSGFGVGMNSQNFMVQSSIPFTYHVLKYADLAGAAFGVAPGGP